LNAEQFSMNHHLPADFGTIRKLLQGKQFDIHRNLSLSLIFLFKILSAPN
jgi:hypothetical protein